MPSIETRVVERGDAWTGQCAQPCGFTSSGWPTEDLAEKRITEHVTEHETGELMSDLQDFRADNGLGVDEQGTAVFADLDEE